MGKKVDYEQVLSHWVERDVTEAIELGQIPPAFCMEPVLEQLRDVLEAGKHAVVTGEAGVGKSAAVFQLVRESMAGQGPAALAGKRVLQISIRSRLSALPNPDNIKPEMQKLVAALIERSDHVVPFFRDLHEAYQADLEPQLEVLALRFRGVILGEADASPFDALIEGTPALDPHYVKVPVAEPNLERMEMILARWSDVASSQGIVVPKEPQLTALHLAHRFLGRLRQPRKTIDLLSQVVAMTAAGEPITSGRVIDRFVRSYRVPDFLANPDVEYDPAKTEAYFRDKLLEQGEAVQAVVRMIALIKSGMSDTRRPFAAFLFVGPTGVGKTHVAQLLAGFLFGSRDRLVRLNLADHSGPEAPGVIFGNSDAYNLQQRRGILTTRLAGHPFAVLLLDEFEKCHASVHDHLLQLIDEGTFINGAGETISCRSLIIIATSNAGAELYRTPGLGFVGDLDVSEIDRELDRRLAREFRHEFLNRFDQVVHFHPLSRRGIRAIALKEISDLTQRIGMRSRDLRLRTDESVLDWLAAHGYHPHFGARFLRRVIERHVTTSIADVVVQEKLPPGTVIELSVRKQRIVARAEPPAVEEERQSVSLPEGPASRKRDLDRVALITEAEALLRTAETSERILHEQQDRASELLGQMGDAQFWASRSEAQRVLEEYRSLDVAIQIGKRLRGPVERLRSLVASGGNAPLKEIARGLEEASRSLAEWLERMEDRGPRRVWVLIRNVDPLRPAPAWVEQLTSIQRRWCRRLHLQCELVAFGAMDDTLTAALLEVEGPGAGSALSMEEGVHRLHRGDAPDYRGRVDVVPAEPNGSAEESEVRAIKRVVTLLELGATSFASIVDADVGTELRLYGADRRVLARAMRDLVAANVLNARDAKTARDYGRDGVGARDPRTGAAIPRLKDVERGKLDALLEAWRRTGLGERTGPEASV